MGASRGQMVGTELILERIRRWVGGGRADGKYEKMEKLTRLGGRSTPTL